MWSPQKDHTRYLGPETALGQPLLPPHASLGLRYAVFSVKGQRTYNESAHAMTSAEGPSRAGPISDRVVKPDALDTNEEQDLDE